MIEDAQKCLLESILLSINEEPNFELNVALSYSFERNYSKGIKCYREALGIFNSIKSISKEYSFQKSQCFQGLGEYSEFQGNLNEAITYYAKAIEVSNNLDDLLN